MVSAVKDVTITKVILRNPAFRNQSLPPSSGKTSILMANVETVSETLDCNSVLVIVAKGGELRALTGPLSAPPR